MKYEPGKIPVFIRFDETPLEQINTHLAKAFSRDFNNVNLKHQKDTDENKTDIKEYKKLFTSLDTNQVEKEHFLITPYSTHAIRI